MDWLLSRLVVTGNESHSESDEKVEDAESGDSVDWADLSTQDSETVDTADSTQKESRDIEASSSEGSSHSDQTIRSEENHQSQREVPVPPDEGPTAEQSPGQPVDSMVETETLDTELLLTNMLRGLDAPTVMFDADGMILRLNSAACELFNTTKAAAVGVPLVSVHSGSDRASGIIESGERLSEFEESVTIDGSQRTLSRTIIPFEDESGAVVGGMEIARDVTQIAVEREKTETLTAYQDTVMETLHQNMVAFADGDLTINPTIPKPEADFDELQDVYDEYTEFNTALSTAIENFRAVLSRLTLLADDLDDTSQELSANSEEVTASVEEINHSTEEIADGTQDLAERTDEADMAVSSLTATIEEITASAQEMDAETSEASKLAIDAVEDGSAAVDQIRTATAATDTIATEVDTLEAKMQEVGSILDVIFTIADQTNLLALNATIEAARAGETGAGFAVVADEVKKLASEAQESAADIETIITAAQDQTTTVSTQIDETTDKVSTGADAVEGVIDQLTEIEHTIEQTSAATGEVSTAVESQAHNMDDMSATIETAASLSEELSASLQEISAGLSQQSTATDKVASRAVELSATSEDLYDRIDRFRLDKSESAALDELSEVESQS
jgi:methyl-accepting chemotaxis protein